MRAARATENVNSTGHRHFTYTLPALPVRIHYLLPIVAVFQPYEHCLALETASAFSESNPHATKSQ